MREGADTTERTLPQPLYKRGGRYYRERREVFVKRSKEQEVQDRGMVLHLLLIKGGMKTENGKVNQRSTPEGAEVKTENEKRRER